MKLKQNLTQSTLFGMFILLSIGFAACTNSPGTQTSQSEQSSPEDVAQSPMAGMGHSMDHGSSQMNMELGPKDEAFDLRFIDAMILHHQGAIEMARGAAEKSDRAEIQQLSQAIIAAQEQEIQQMKEWRQTWYPDADAEPMMYNSGMGHMMPMSEEMRSSMMMDVDLGTADETFDARFIDAMIPHHEGAVTMAEEALEKSDRSEIRELAQAIIDSQQQEIDQMKQWKQSWYGQ